MTNVSTTPALTLAGALKAFGGYFKPTPTRLKIGLGDVAHDVPDADFRVARAVEDRLCGLLGLQRSSATNYIKVEEGLDLAGLKKACTTKPVVAKRPLEITEADALASRIPEDGPLTIKGVKSWALIIALENEGFVEKDGDYVRMDPVDAIVTGIKRAIEDARTVGKPAGLAPPPLKEVPEASGLLGVVVQAMSYDATQRTQAAWKNKAAKGQKRRTVYTAVLQSLSSEGKTVEALVRDVGHQYTADNVVYVLGNNPAKFIISGGKVGLSDQGREALLQRS